MKRLTIAVAVISPLAVFALWAAVVMAQARPVIRGTQGDDVLEGTDNGENIEALGGNDVARGKGGEDLIAGDNGNDQLHGDGGPDTLSGGGGDDILHGGEGDDVLDGGAQKDQTYGDDGNDRLKGGAHDDYLDGGNGADTVDGDTGDDLVIGRDGNDKLIGGSEDDIIVIIGNSVMGYQAVHGDASPPTGNTGDDLLFFARDVNPDNVQTVVLQGYPHTELTSLELRTDQPVDLDVAASPNLKQVEVFITGSANDHIRGTDFADTDTYWTRLYRAGNPLELGEFFMTGPGDDTIETRGGDDFVDAGEQNDRIIAGPGEHYLITGPGNDVVVLKVAELNGPKGNKICRVVDFSSSDKVILEGQVTPADVTLQDKVAAGVTSTTVLVKGRAEFELTGVPKSKVHVRPHQGGVEVSGSALATPGAGPADTVAPKVISPFVAERAKAIKADADKKKADKAAKK